MEASRRIRLRIRGYRLGVAPGVARPTTLIARGRIVGAGLVRNYFLGQDDGLGEVRRKPAADEEARAGPRLCSIRLERTVGQYFHRLVADRSRSALDCEHVE